MILRRTSVFVLLAALFALLPFAVSAQEGEEEPVAEQEAEAAPADTAEEESPYEDFAELTEGAEVHEGFFDLYEKDGKLWLAVEPDRIGEDFFMEYKLDRGVGANYLFGGLMLSFFETNLVAVEKRGQKLYLVQRPHRFTAKDDRRAAEAVELTFGSSILESAKVVSLREDSAWVAEVSGWFVSDLANVSRRVEQAVSTEPGRPGSARLDEERSYLEEVESFPENTNVKAKLTFAPGEPVGWPSVADGRYLPLTVHYTLGKLPERPMTPRSGDERVGHFWTVHKDFSDTDTTFFVRMVNRWRLEKGERVGDRWRPVEPITYYIDPNVPEEYRQAMKEGVEAWNDAFEAAGWEGAIRAEDLPEGADPADIRYATLRWNVSDQPGYGAIGPSVVDPRTGEILDADILFEASMFLGQKETWRDFVDPVSAATALRMALGTGPFAAVWEDDAQASTAGVELPGFAAALQEQALLVSALRAVRGDAPEAEVPDAYVRQFAKWVTMHEVGHTLGLQHNFRSSAATPLARLHDEEWTARNGLTNSVMEYPTVNVAHDEETESGHWFSPGVGTYDRWAIAYAYAPDDDVARTLARQVAAREHLFGNEAGGPGALDPTINTWDLSDDPLAWGRGRTGLVRELWAELPDAVLRDDDRYYELTLAFQGALNQYVRALAPAVKYLGGAYLNRDHVGDPNGRLPYGQLALADQREALDLIVERVFAAEAFDLSPELLRKMGPNRWTHWGTSTTFDGRLDYPWHEQVAGLQDALLEELLHPFRLSRIRDAEARYGAEEVVGIPELMERITSAAWSELATGANVPTTRRDLQRSWIEAMTTLVVDAPERTPADARALARSQLREVGERVDDRLAAGGELDAYTAAHLEESRARIREALRAGLEIER